MASIQIAPTRRSGLFGLWSSTIGKKAVVAVSGLIMVLFLLLHMLGNLKIFFGATDFDDYAAFLRRIGEPVLHGAWFLWIQRVVLFAALVLHVVGSVQLTLRDLHARPVKYNGRQAFRATVTTRYMRTGGAIILLFLIWHLVNLSAGAAIPHYQETHAYSNVVEDFSRWWTNVIYIAAMLFVGLHIHHGFESSTRTLGFHRPSRARTIRIVGDTLAVAITVGFIAVPVGVMTGLVS